jgi:cytoskeletal protein CcmA (bactofilin family)
MTFSLLGRLSILALLVSMTMPAALAKSSSSTITQFGRDIRIGEGQQADEVTCFNCSVYVRGQVAGEITTFHGNIVIEGNGQVGGEVTAFLGDVRLDEGTQIAGEVTVMGGRIRRPPSAKIAGDVTVFQGTGWIYVMLLSPFLVLAGIIALIVWLVRRRRPAPAMARAA